MFFVDSPEQLVDARRRARLDAGFDNVEALAVAAGVSHNTVRAYERGARVRATTQKRIEDAIRRRAGDGKATLDDLVEAVQALRAEVRALRAELQKASESDEQPSWPRL